MNLISFSIKTKGIDNFARRLWTVFTRFGITETRTRQALLTTIETLRQYEAAPTFFIPAIVLRRHPALLADISQCGVEIGIHGYIHNDYRSLSAAKQFKQTEQAISIFQSTNTPYQGFRNPYLGWTEESLAVFTALHFTYESNEAIFHDVIDLDLLPPLLRGGYEKSLLLFQALPSNAYTLRPHFEGPLVRIPTSIPDDEMLFDRLRITEPGELGSIWSKVMQRVYDLGGVYTLNLHPERAIPCKEALTTLLSYAYNRPFPVWLARLQDIAQWWKERSNFQLVITSLAFERWQVQAVCSPRATLLARNLTVEYQPVTSWYGNDNRLQAHDCIVNATLCPCIGISPQTPREVADFLHEQGYSVVCSTQEETYQYALYLDLPEGFGTTREEQTQQRSSLLQRIEQLDAPLLYFGCWPDGKRAALAITGDIDSVTIQDFFLRIFEVSRST
jgi:peptidoglycan/xylan/chitin deacetylase (PgdA/CDA1 family)